MPALPLERHRLRNGLRVVLNPDAALPIVCLNVWYHAGSRNDPPARSGTAHLLEHMLFQGGVAADDHQQRIHMLGGNANGSTWYDRTTYFDTVPSHALELALWLESNRMQLLIPLSEERLAVQRTVILNERRQMRDMRPYGRAHELLNELVLPPGHPYRTPVMGVAEDIERIHLRDLQDFFRTFYTPRNAVLTLAGDFRPEQAISCIERYFAGIDDGTPPFVPPPSTTACPSARVHLCQPIDLVRLYFGFRLPPYGDRDWHAADLLGAALATGRSSLLQRELVHKRQWALDVAYSVLPTEWCATFTLMVVCRPGVDPDRVRDFVLLFLENLASEPLPELVLNRCRNRILTQFFREIQLLDKRADALSRLTAYFDDPDLVKREVDMYRALGQEHLSQVAANHLRPEQAAVLTYVPHR